MLNKMNVTPECNWTRDIRLCA